MILKANTVCLKQKRHKRAGQSVDSLVVIPNEIKVFLRANYVVNAFDAADDVLRQGVKVFQSLLKYSFINLGLADVTAVTKDAGQAHGRWQASGKDKAEQAAKAAISSPLLETTIDGANGVIINFTSSPDIGLDEVEQAAALISNAAHSGANIIWGVAFDETLNDEIEITVIATGFGKDANGNAKKPPKAVDEKITKAAAELEDIISQTGYDVSEDIFSTYLSQSPTPSGNGSVGFGMDDDDIMDSIANIFNNKNKQ